ncbi:unnamed protein product [Choristocarpus tenellus]
MRSSSANGRPQRNLGYAESAEVEEPGEGLPLRSNTTKALGEAAEETYYPTMVEPATPQELRRRCFSCCNAVLQIRGGDDEATMLMDQPQFSEHPLLKQIRDRVSLQRYLTMEEFVDDFERFAASCLNEKDQSVVIQELNRHVAKTSVPVLKRVGKASFKGFTQPLIDDIMVEDRKSRQKDPSGLKEFNIGRFFGIAYGHGLARGARFTGKESKEMEYNRERAEKEDGQRALVAEELQKVWPRHGI